MQWFDDMKKFFNPRGEADDDDEIYDDFFEKEDLFNSHRSRSDRPTVENRRGKVVNIHATTQLQVVLVTVTEFDTVKEIADHLRDKHTVLVKLEKTEKETARRVMDFISGVAYATEGKIGRVSDRIYMVAPYSVEIQGDLLNELSHNGFY